MRVRAPARREEPRVADEVQAPDWVLKEVLPAVGGPVHSVQMMTSKSVVVFGHDHALVAEKGTMGGLRMYRVEYPTGLLLQGAACPHCGKPIREPVAKIAKLAATPKKAAPKRKRR